jgi:ABC-2 type transport system permease protein
MDRTLPWAIVMKDFSVFRTKKSIVFSLAIFPVVIGVGLPAVIWLLMRRSALSPDVVVTLLDAFSFFFIIIPSLIPVTLASYSIMGEKAEKSLEPLLSTPATDGDILLGKGLAAFLPSIAATLAGAIIFMVISDILTFSILGHLFFPNWSVAIILLLAVPFICMMSVELNLIISARTSDLRTAYNLGASILLPFGAIYVLFELGYLPFTETNLLIISAVVLLIGLLLLPVIRSAFRREEILTKWR